MTALALVAVMAPAPAARPRERQRSCYPARTTTLAANAHARVFQTRRLIPETRTHVTYGCLLSRKRPFRFYVPDFATGYGPIALAGRFAGYGAYSDCAASFCDPNGVVLQDLRSGKVTFVDGSLRVASVTSLVLRATGGVAWIQSTFSESGSPQPSYQVVKAELGSGPVVLDSGPTIAPASLALAGATLYWTSGGAPVSAVLR